MKNPTNAGFEQNYNVQVAVDQGSLLIVANALSNHPNDSQEAEPTLDAMPSAIGMPDAAALDAGYLAPQRWLLVRNAASSLMSPLAVIPIIQAGSSVSRRCPIHRLRTRALKSRWPTSSRPRWAKRSMGQEKHRRTGDRDHQRGAGLPPVLFAR